jgi:hypothetical protein
LGIFIFCCVSLWLFFCVSTLQQSSGQKSSRSGRRILTWAGIRIRIRPCTRGHTCRIQRTRCSGQGKTSDAGADSAQSQSRFEVTDQFGERHQDKKGVGPHASYLFAVHPQPHPPLQSSPHFPHPPWQLSRYGTSVSCFFSVGG